MFVSLLQGCVFVVGVVERWVVTEVANDACVDRHFTLKDYSAILAHGDFSIHRSVHHTNNPGQ